MAGQPVTQPQRWRSLGSLIFRIGLIESVGEIRTDLTMAEDIDWITRAEAAGHRFADIDEVLYFHRVHRSNVTGAMNDSKRADMADVVMAHLARARKAR